MNNIDIKSFIIGLLSSLCLLLFLGHSKTIPDEIKCRSLVLLNENGKEVVWMGASESNGGYIETINENGGVTTKITGGSIRSYNKFGNPTLYMGQSDGGDGMITTTNKYESQTSYIGSNTSNGGLITVSGKTGNRVVSIYSSDGSGVVDLQNNSGEDIVYLGASDQDQGMMVLNDKSGNKYLSCSNGALRTYYDERTTSYLGNSTIGTGLIILSDEEEENGGLFLNPQKLTIKHSAETEALVLGGGYMFMNDTGGNNYAYLGYNKNTYNGMFAIYDNRGDLIFAK